MNADDFWASALPEPNSGCHLWERCVNPRGYGVVNWQGSARLAHRVAFSLFYGEPKRGAVVGHRCDNPACVNPSHLFLGSQADNVRDMDRKGRRRNAPLRGSRHPNAKLSADAVGIIRAHIGPARIMASRFGVTPEQINNIRRGAQRRNG